VRGEGVVVVACRKLGPNEEISTAWDAPVQNGLEVCCAYYCRDVPIRALNICMHLFVVCLLSMRFLVYKDFRVLLDLLFFKFNFHILSRLMDSTIFLLFYPFF